MAFVLNLQNQFQSLRADVEILNKGIEPQFLQMALNFEDCRQKWLQVDEELGACKEVLSKTETERGSFEVKLKHARNQVDVEIRRRQKAEADYEKLERQIQLIRELLISESTSSSVHLSEEQRSALAFLSAHSQAAQEAKTNLNNRRRLTTIDESTSILSDISYDKSDDSMDWDSSVIKTVRLRKRQRQHSVRHQTDGPPQVIKKLRPTAHASEKGNELPVAQTTSNGGPVSTIETMPNYTRNQTKTAQAWDGASTDQSECVREGPSKAISDPPSLRRLKVIRAGPKHELIPKTVIKSELCVPCGRKTKFGKLYLKCKDCRMVTHPECRDRCPLPCNRTVGDTPVKAGEATLADYTPSTFPMVPPLVVCCVKEIEQRGLHEVGLYRISGSERTVRELKRLFLLGKIMPLLGKVEDINVITGFLKDFLRSLPEPLLTFCLNRAFMEAAEIQDDVNSHMYQTISELPLPNRDTLAFLMVHLQRVAQCVDTKMNISKLARVFGPTLVGHAVPDPDPMTILQDTNRQQRVIERLLSIPAKYWNQFTFDKALANVMDNANDCNTREQKVTTPEHQMTKTASSSSLSQRMRQTLSSTTIFGGKTKRASISSHQVNLFASPLTK